MVVCAGLSCRFVRTAKDPCLAVEGMYHERGPLHNCRERAKFLNVMDFAWKAMLGLRLIILSENLEP
jgi:hypothetical protein